MSFVWYSGAPINAFDPAETHDVQLLVDVPPDDTLIRALVWFECSEIRYQQDNAFLPNFSPTACGLYWRSGFARDTPIPVSSIGADENFTVHYQGVNWDAAITHDATQAYSGGEFNGPNEFGTRIIHYSAPRDGKPIDSNGEFRIARLDDPFENALWFSIGFNQVGGDPTPENFHSFYLNLSYRILLLHR